MEKNLQENERIDDLQYKELKIIQNTKGFCFGIDSVILSDFAKNIKKGSKVVDLGTGTGIIGLLLCKKTELKEIVGVEIQKEVAEMATRSIKMNKLEDKFVILNTDINQIFANKLLEKNQFDAIVMNPPYKEIGTGQINDVDNKIISRHEIKATLSDFLRVASNLLKDKGEIYMVHKPERMPDIIQKMRENKIEPKEIQVVYPSKNADASLILIKGIKGANKFFKIQKPLYIYEEKRGIYNTNKRNL